MGEKTEYPEYEFVRKIDDKTAIVRLIDDDVEKVVKLTKDGQVKKTSLAMPNQGKINDGAKIMPRDVSSKNMMMLNEIHSWGKCSLQDPEEVRERLNNYFIMCSEYELRPTVSGLGFAVGVDRRRINEFTHGDYHQFPKGANKACIPVIVEYYDMMQVMFESALSEERGNPTKWIFLGKNNYDYRDVHESIVAHHAQEEVRDKEEIARKYLEEMGRLG